MTDKNHSHSGIIVMMGAMVVLIALTKGAFAQDFTPVRLMGETAPDLIPEFPVESEILKRQQELSVAGAWSAPTPRNDEASSWRQDMEAVAWKSMAQPRFHLKASLLGGWEYDDNIHLAQGLNNNGGASSNGASDTANSVYVRVPVAIDYTGGLISLKAAYIPEFRAYDGGGLGDTFNQAANLDVIYAGPKLQLGLDVNFAQTDGGSVEVGDVVKSIIVFNSLTAAYAITPVTSMGASFAFNDNEYQEYDSNKRYTTQVYMDYKVSPKTQLGLGVGYDQSIVSEGLNSAAPSVSGRINWQISDKIALRGMAGYEWRKYDDGTVVLPGSPDAISGIGNTFASPTFSIGTLYDLSADTKIALDVYRKNNPSISEIDQSYYATGVVLTVNQTIFGRFKWSLSTGYENADYVAAVQELVANRVDNHWFARPKLSYTIAKSVTLSTYYQYSKNDSNADGNSFSRNQVGATISYDF